MTDRHGNEEMVFETDKSHDLLHVVLPKEDPGHRFDMPLPKTKTSLSDDILDILLSVVSIAVLIWVSNVVAFVIQTRSISVFVLLSYSPDRKYNQ